MGIVRNFWRKAERCRRRSGDDMGFFFPVVVTAQTGEAANESAADRG